MKKGNLYLTSTNSPLAKHIDQVGYSTKETVYVGYVPTNALVLFLRSRKRFGNCQWHEVIYQDQVGWVIGDLQTINEKEVCCEPEGDKV